MRSINATFAFLVFGLFSAQFAMATNITCKNIHLYNHPNWEPTQTKISLRSTNTAEWDFKLEAPKNRTVTGRTTPQLVKGSQNLDESATEVAKLIYPKEALGSYEIFPILDQGTDSTGVSFFRLFNEKGNFYGAFVAMGWGFGKCSNL